jgi:excisionase family DNA binding protein
MPRKVLKQLKSSQPVYLTKELASKESGLSIRRLLELASAGKIHRIHRLDPKTKRHIALFDAADIHALAERSASNVLQISSPVRTSALVAALPQPTATSPKWLTIDEAAAYLRLPPEFLKRLIQAGNLPAFDVGVRAGGRYRISRNALDDLEAPGSRTKDQKKRVQTALPASMAQPFSWRPHRRTERKNS